jgi:hypothetical protein
MSEELYEKYKAIIDVLEENDVEIEFYMKQTGKTLDQVVQDSLAIYGMCIEVSKHGQRSNGFHLYGARYTWDVDPGCVWILGSDKNGKLCYYEDVKITKSARIKIGRP